MRKVITAKEAEELLRKGESVPADAILTPSARDLLQGRVKLAGQTVAQKATQPTQPPRRRQRRRRNSLSRTTSLGGRPEAIRRRRLRSRGSSSRRHPDAQTAHLRHGRRIWEKNYVDGNGGNITLRVGDNLVLCTPTLISKGFMTPEDICLIDLDANQVAGTRKRTSEAKTHLAIMKAQPRRRPASTPIRRTRPPSPWPASFATCMIPEAEVFLGEIGYAKYATPGTPAVAEEVARIAVDHYSVLMENHGVIVWGKDVEDAQWKMENTDAYCQVIWIASQLNGGSLRSIGGEKLRDLMALRKSLGMQDRREG